MGGSFSNKEEIFLFDTEPGVLIDGGLVIEYFFGILSEISFGGGHFIGGVSLTEGHETSIFSEGIFIYYNRFNPNFGVFGYGLFS